MNKSKIAIGLMTAMLSAGALAGCDNTVKYSNDGTIISYHTKDDSQEKPTSADELLQEYYKDSSKYQSIFDAVYSIVVRNYFKTVDEPVEVIKTGTNGKRTKETIRVGISQVDGIKNDAQKKVDSDKETAKLNAKNNSTNYNDEFNSILSSKGAKDEAELKEKYIEEIEKETFDSNFYKYHINEIKTGDESVKYGDNQQLWTGYLNDMVPYHVSHILVKVEDGSGTNYANGTISEANAEKLFNVVDALAKGADSFGTLAHRFSEDTGSAANYGDLGIMDYSTGYVNEFKLGIYAYENFMGDKVNDVITKKSNILIPGNVVETPEVKISGIAASYQDQIKSSFDDSIPSIDFSVFQELQKVAKIDKDVNGKSVLDDSANFYPRNIIYNKYLNRHSIAYIVNSAKTENVGTLNSGFYKEVKVMDPETNTEVTKYALCVKTKSGEWTPVLCARAGSDYQGLHFIVVNRSPFVSEVNGVKLDEYYTTYYPEQEDYPSIESVDAEGKYSYSPKDTYVNYSSSVTAETKSRAESFVSTIKSYDSERLNKYIYRRYFNMEKLQLNHKEGEVDLQDLLDKWIDRGFEKKAEEKKDAWEKTWNDYIDTLRKQNAERSKLVSQACRIAYLNANGLNEDKTDTTFDTVVDPVTGETLLQSMVKAMILAGEATDATDAEKKIKQIKIGDKTFDDRVTKVAELFKKEGALCNDGKEHF